MLRSHGHARMMALGGLLWMLAGSASAQATWNGQPIEIEYWAGSGSSSAVMVVDFSASATPGEAYAFGFRWDGAATSETMLLALDGDGIGGTLDVQYHNDAVFGFGLDGLSYDGYSIVSDGWITTFPGSWWDGYDAYNDFLGNPVPGEAPNGTFAVAQLGASSRTLSDGYVDGWSQELVANGYDPIHTPTVPVPEPMTMSLLGIGAVALLRRRR